MIMLFAFSGYPGDFEDSILNRGFRIKPKMKIINIPPTVLTKPDGTNCLYFTMKKVEKKSFYRAQKPERGNCKALYMI